ncbi:hypothetical protein OEA41_008219 [Lepraria neglecta]|uniref:Uncharacterized protein n=1 Tax=Lepraria neglecta TaxID=209136 RepID=A0AAE0DNP1_9LECA|nr:hypothetical protein OEA41_007457 [Lepraria neglecta]KAK3176893.1 hypothetical protein OEA41_008219 [Lepraria neglecta]
MLPQSSSALFLRARAQKAIDLVPDTPSRTSITSFRHDLLDEDDDSDGAGPETQLSNTQTYFDTQQPQIRRHSSESLFVGVEGESNKRWTQARKEISRREDVFGESEETPKDVDNSQSTAGQQSHGSTTNQKKGKANSIHLDSEDELESPGRVAFKYKLAVRSFWEKDIQSSIIRSQTFRDYTVDGSNDILIRTMHNQQKEFAAKWAIERGHACFRVSVQATPFYEKLTGPNRRSTTAETQQDWYSVEDELREWQKDGKKGLQVDLIYHWARNSTGEIPVVGKAAEKKPGTIVSGTARGSTHIPTNRLLGEMDETNAGEPWRQKQQEIHNRWACKSSICSNTGHYCYLHKGEHIPFLPRQSKMWAVAILRDTTGRISDDEPPASLLVELQQTQKKEARKEKRRHTTETPTQPTTTPAYPTIGGQFGQPPPLYPYGYSFQPGFQPLISGPQSLRDTRTSDLIKELRSRDVDPTETTTRPPHSISRSVTATPGLSSYRNSSPVEGELAEFVGWLSKKHPEYIKAYEEAKDELMDQGYTTDIIQAWKNDEHEEQWRKLGIKPGIGRQLARNVSKWGRERQVQTTLHVGGLGRTLPLSPSRQRLASRPQQTSYKQGHIIPSVETKAYEDETQDDDPDIYDLYGGANLSDSDCFAETQLETQAKT